MRGTDPLGCWSILPGRRHIQNYPRVIQVIQVMAKARRGQKGMFWIPTLCARIGGWVSTERDEGEGEERP